MSAKLKFIFFISIFTLISAIANGQILNIEKARLDSLTKEKPFRVNFTSKLNFYNRSAGADEKVKFTSFSNELNAVFGPGNHSYMVMGKSAYTKNNTESILHNGYLHLRTHFNHKNEWSFESYGQLQYDKFRGLSNRYLLGGAVRWRAYNHEKFTFGFGTGPMYETEIWKKTNESGYLQVQFLKLSSYFITRWDITKNTNLNTVFYYQVGYDSHISSTRNRLSLSTNFNFKISKYLTFTTSVDMAFEDKPVIPITRMIYEIENGLTLTFWFLPWFLVSSY